ncbi:MAG: TIGR00375 family protein [Candidatus Aenigmarchaeota archaeon]|nr:TIGR00375 family protein [Candidatus Aenigmarchaeota archaeon]
MVLEFNADLHIHSKYARGTSNDMEIPLLAKQAKLKGITLLGTGDCIHGKWLGHIKENLSGEGIYDREGTKFVMQTEVQDNQRVHHIIFLPSISKAEELREKLMRHSSNLDADGRPWLKLNGEEIAEFVISCGGLIGPAHAFTPYFGVYAHNDTLQSCYGKNTKSIQFLELGLSADSILANGILELKGVTFLSNSDCHSPYPLRLAREFNRLRLEDFTFEEFAKALRGENGRGVILNCGFYPEHGKYHATRCKTCLAFYSLDDAIRHKWRCQNCGGVIKKGVADRIRELSSYEGNPNRPKYIHIYPLTEIIATAYGITTLSSSRVSRIWEMFVEKFGNEIEVLINAPIEEIAKIDEKTAQYIRAFREDKIEHIPGGGGVYGKLLPLGQKAEVEQFKKKQMNLGDF